MDESLLERLKMLKIEDLLWCVLIGLILLSMYANNIERDFLITNSKESKKKYRELIIFIFSVAFLIYLFYVISGYQDLMRLTEEDSFKRVEYANLSYIASVFILLAGIIYLYIAITDTEIEAELAL